MRLSSIEAKVTVAKLLEVAYSKDNGLVTKILADKGMIRLSVDHNGKAVLSSPVGIISFHSDQTFKNLAIKIKRVNVILVNGDDQDINYKAAFDFGYSKLIVTGHFNLEKLLLSCSGLLCQAAKALKGKHAAYELELRDLMEAQ